eukprot:TRINITY_DN121564_c0_g1_i1.p1 TRINITY_DN121564_c0_g1~~TRINITY_DN121564_c0_g1_i1.p1  ORF type:complete len:555 (-),score=90.21 TRINITY_DN121564_c0_g1_i1:76-1740(-)
MKFFLLESASVLSFAVLQSVAEAATLGLRGNKRAEQTPEIVGQADPAWFGRTFADSPVAINVWSDPGLHALPSAILGSLQPTAPLDRVDAPGSFGASVTGAETVSPGNQKFGVQDYIPPTHIMPDYIPPNYAPPTFPADEALTVNVHDNPLIDMNDRTVMARADVLRKVGFVPPWADARKAALNNYPLTAPADRMSGDGTDGAYVTAHADRVPEMVARFLTESHKRNIQVRDFKAQVGAFKTADANQDGVISEEEFLAEVVTKQGKADEEGRKLWNKFHTSGGGFMTRAEYERLARTGFDVGAISRNVTGVLTPSAVPGGASLSIDRGFWGNGASCPDGAFVNGASLKRMPYFSAPPTKDNSGLNAIKLVCSDGSDVSSSEGPDGSWSSPQNCPDGQVVLGVSVRGMALTLGVDNSGINDLQFVCGVPVSATDREMSPASRLWAAASPHNTLVNSAAKRLSNNLAHSFAGPHASHLPDISLKKAVTNAADPNAAANKRLVFPGGPTEGGFMLDLMCPIGDAICGTQVRLRTDQGEEGDDMGVTDVRFYCCKAVQ